VSDRISTIGHSTLPADDFVAHLTAADVAAIADVRRFPGSRRHPQFGGAALQKTLAAAGIAYRWFEDLGGRRDAKDLSLDNAAWRVAAFHAYADWMRTPTFRAALAELEGFARTQPTALMCAEALWTRCHRRLIADALLAQGWEVVHLIPPNRIEAHRPPEFAQFTAGGIRYPLPLLR
jgi:uncharacterized protein (DUF488 family)